MTIALDLGCPQSGTPRSPRKRPSAAPRLLVELRRRAALQSDGAVVASVAELAEALDVSERTIQFATSDLAETGLIKVTAAPRKDAANTYTPTL